MSTPSHAGEIVERGYTVFDAAWSAEAVADLRAEIEALVRELDPPALVAATAQPLCDWAMLTPTGLALHRVLHRRPHLAGRVLAPQVVDTVRALLGDDMRLEVAGAVVSDSTRPFFTWHTHIEGIDEGERVRAGRWPKVDRVRRVLTLLYLDALDDEGGSLLVLPRRVGDPTEPRGPLDVPEWPGHVEVRARPGTLVALEQCTWHAARPRRRAGRRILWGCYFAAAGEPPGTHADPRLHEVASNDPRFRALVDRS